MRKYCAQLKEGQLSDLRDRGAGSDPVAPLSGAAAPAGVQPPCKWLQQRDVLALALDPQCDRKLLERRAFPRFFRKNATYREASEIGAEWKRIGTHLMNLKKENRVAILLDNLSLAGLRQFPLETTGDHSYNAVMRWLADALYRRNIEFDMVSSGERDFSAYDFLVVPALYAASDDLLGALDRYAWQKADT